MIPSPQDPSWGPRLPAETCATLSPPLLHRDPTAGIIPILQVRKLKPTESQHLGAGLHPLTLIALRSEKTQRISEGGNTGAQAPRQRAETRARPPEMRRPEPQAEERPPGEEVQGDLQIRGPRLGDGSVPQGTLGSNWRHFWLSPWEAG